MSKISLTEIANNAKALNKFVGSTIAGYKAVGVALHQSACAVLFHTAEHGDVFALNNLYQGLRVNDQTALRVWLGKHTSYVDLANGETRNWLKFSAKDGFSVVKGTAEHRNGIFIMEGKADGKTTLIDLAPFFDKDVKTKDAFTLEELLKMLGKAAERAENKAKAEGINLSADVLNIIQSTKNTTTKELADIARVKGE
jgi:hypothetical protein